MLRKTCFVLVAVVILWSSTLGAQTKQLQQAWKVSTGNFNPLALIVDQRDKVYYYAAEKEGGLSVWESDTEKKAATRIANLKPNPAFKGLAVTHFVQQENLLFVSLGEFFKKKSKRGVALVDVRNPASPKVLDVWVSKSEGKGSTGILVRRKTIYLAAMKTGVSILSHSNGKLTHIRDFLPDVHFPRKNPSEIQHPNARGLDIKKNLLFVANDAGGLRVLNVSNPKKPVEISKYINARMRWKQQAYNTIIVSGNIAYAGVDYAGLEILDVSNPRKITQLGWLNPWKAETWKNTWFNSPGHVNQIVLDKKTRQIFMSAGDSEVMVVNVKDPKRPALVAQAGKPKNQNGTWGVTVTDKFIYSIDIKTVIPFRGNWAGIRAYHRNKKNSR